MNNNTAKKKEFAVEHGLILNSYIASKNYRIHLKGYNLGKNEKYNMDTQEEYLKDENELKTLGSSFNSTTKMIKLS